MALGFVLVMVDSHVTGDREVLDRLLDVDGVEEVFPLFGEYDFIVKLDASDFDALAKAVFDGIRAIPGISRTETLTVTKLDLDG